MKKIPTKLTILILILVGFFIYFPNIVNAAGCGFVCNDNPSVTALNYCTKVRGAGSTLGTTMAPLTGDGLADCAGTASCGMNTVPICCCTASSSLIVPASGTKSEPTTLFTMPDFQVQIPGLNKLATITCPTEGECNIPWLGQYITGIYNYALAIVGILAALILMGGGLLWLISGGDASRISQAKELIIGSITGLVIMSASYIILLQVNPNLVNLSSVSIKYIPKIENLAASRNNTTAGDYRNSPCATDAELANGINFYATGYYKPAWEDSDTFRCVVAMQCSCPAGYGRDLTKNCDALYGKTFPNYHPCAAFPANTPYCNMTKSGSAPKDGDIAGPGNCTANLPTGSKVCFKGNTYTITDTGGGIQGKRLDIWSGSNLDKANSNTGVGLFKKGACN